MRFKSDRRLRNLETLLKKCNSYELGALAGAHALFDRCRNKEALDRFLNKVLGPGKISLSDLVKELNQALFPAASKKKSDDQLATKLGDMVLGDLIPPNTSKLDMIATALELPIAFLRCLQELADDEDLLHVPVSSGNVSAMVIGRRLREFREAADLTREQLAKGLFEPSYLEAIELGKIRPSMRVLTLLAKRLRVSLEDLFKL